MARTLTVVAGTGIAISAVCLGIAVALGGAELANLDFIHFGSNLKRCGADTGPAPTEDRREFAWHGGNEVNVDVPATVHYRPGTGMSVIASGPPDLVKHLRVSDSDIRFDCRGMGSDRMLDIVLPGRPLQEFTINGTGRLMLDDLDQKRLEVSIHGNADVRAAGKAEALELSIAGSGKADLGGLAVDRAEVNIAGSGEASVAPKERAEINIAGSGLIRFITQPKKLETHIVGSGRIVNAPENAGAAAPGTL